MKPLLLGEAPSRSGDRYWRWPLSGPAAVLLCDLAGIEPDADGSRYGRYYWPLRERFEIINAVPRFADAYPWDAERARDRVNAWVRENVALGEMLVVVALGRLASSAIYLDAQHPWGEWHNGGTMRATALPHPSGRNLLLNEPQIRALMARTLREALAGVEA